jgi:hypothetical protein
MPQDWVFGALYRMFLYHWAHPLQYIGLVSLFYSVVATVAILLPGNPVGKWPRLAIPLIIVLSIAIASPAGGALWVIHDMQAGMKPVASCGGEGTRRRLDGEDHFPNPARCLVPNRSESRLPFSAAFCWPCYAY